MTDREIIDEAIRETNERRAVIRGYGYESRLDPLWGKWENFSYGKRGDLRKDGNGFIFPGTNE